MDDQQLADIIRPKMSTLKGSLERQWAWDVFESHKTTRTAAFVLCGVAASVAGGVSVADGVIPTPLCLIALVLLPPLAYLDLRSDRPQLDLSSISPMPSPAALIPDLEPPTPVSLDDVSSSSAYQGNLTGSDQRFRPFHVSSPPWKKFDVRRARLMAVMSAVLLASLCAPLLLVGILNDSDKNNKASWASGVVRLFLGSSGYDEALPLPATLTVLPHLLAAAMPSLGLPVSSSHGGGLVVVLVNGATAALSATLLTLRRRSGGGGGGGDRNDDDDDDGAAAASMAWGLAFAHMALCLAIVASSLQAERESRNMFVREAAKKAGALARGKEDGTAAALSLTIEETEAAATGIRQKQQQQQQQQLSIQVQTSKSSSSAEDTSDSHPPLALEKSQTSLVACEEGRTEPAVSAEQEKEKEQQQQQQPEVCLPDRTLFGMPPLLKHVSSLSTATDACEDDMSVISLPNICNKQRQSVSTSDDDEYSFTSEAASVAAAVAAAHVSSLISNATFDRASGSGESSTPFSILRHSRPGRSQPSSVHSTASFAGLTARTWTVEDNNPNSRRNSVKSNPPSPTRVHRSVNSLAPVLSPVLSPVVSPPSTTHLASSRTSHGVQKSGESVESVEASASDNYHPNMWTLGHFHSSANDSSIGDNSAGSDLGGGSSSGGGTNNVHLIGMGSSSGGGGGSLSTSLDSIVVAGGGGSDNNARQQHDTNVNQEKSSSSWRQSSGDGLSPLMRLFQRIGDDDEYGDDDFVSASYDNPSAPSLVPALGSLAEEAPSGALLDRNATALYRVISELIMDSDDEGSATSERTRAVEDDEEAAVGGGPGGSGEKDQGRDKGLGSDDNATKDEEVGETVFNDGSLTVGGEGHTFGQDDPEENNINAGDAAYAAMGLLDDDVSSLGTAGTLTVRHALLDDSAEDCDGQHPFLDDLLTPNQTPPSASSIQVFFDNSYGRDANNAPGSTANNNNNNNSGGGGVGWPRPTSPPGQLAPLLDVKDDGSVVSLQGGRVSGGGVGQRQLLPAVALVGRHNSKFESSCADAAETKSSEPHSSLSSSLGGGTIHLMETATKSTLGGGRGGGGGGSQEGFGFVNDSVKEEKSPLPNLKEATDRDVSNRAQSEVEAAAAAQSNTAKKKRVDAVPKPLDAGAAAERSDTKGALLPKSSF